MHTLKATLLAVCLGTASSLSLADDCGERPEKPGVPDGAKSTIEEMVAGQTEVKAFVAAGEEYVACLNEAEEAAMADLNKEDEEAVAAATEANTARIATHNAVVDEMTAIAEEWSGSMAAYKEAQAAK